MTKINITIYYKAVIEFRADQKIEDAAIRYLCKLENKHRNSIIIEDILGGLKAVHPWVAIQTSSECLTRSIATKLLNYLKRFKNFELLYS